MAKASTLIVRNSQGSQLPSFDQLWVIQATEGTQYNVGFLKEFVKKHLFTDPETPATPTDMQAKAGKLLQKINLFGQLQDAVSPVIDAATLRFLKMKKLVLARTVQGTCSVCHRKDTDHEWICANCGHKHAKPWGGHPCGALTDGGQDCACIQWQQKRGGITGVCNGFTDNDYGLHRSAKQKENPFAGSGGACSGTNSVILMDEIDLQAFKDVVVGAIKAKQPWDNNATQEGVELRFGAGTVMTIKNTDSLVEFNTRAKALGVKVDVQRNGDVYRIKHFRDIIA